MRRYLCLLLFLLTISVTCGCQEADQVMPGIQVKQTAPAVPEWKDQLQLIDGADGQTASCSADGKMLLVQTDQGAELVENLDGSLRMIAVLQSELPLISSVLSADGQWAATADAKSLTVYSTTDGSKVSTVRFTQTVAQVSLQISQDGTSVACLSAGWLSLYHGPNLSLRWSSEVKETQVAPLLLMSSNGLTLAVCGDNLNVFASDGASPLWTASLSGQALTGVLSADGVYLAIQIQQSTGPNLLRVFERWVAEPTWEFGISGVVTCLQFSPDSNWLALSADQFYLFRCLLNQPVMQLTQSGAASLIKGQILLIEDKSLYRFDPTVQSLVSFRLPLQVVGEMCYLYSEQEWLFALNKEGMLFLVKLPLIPDSSDF